MSADSGNDQQLEHYVSEAPFDPRSVEALSPEQERYYMASQWQLMWWKFIRHRLALISGGFLLLMYGSILISEFLAPYNLHTRNINAIFAPPQSVHFFHEGEFKGPFVYGTHYKLNLTNLAGIHGKHIPDLQDELLLSRRRIRFLGSDERQSTSVLCRGGGTLFLLGTDRLGRDILSRIIYGAHIAHHRFDRNCDEFRPRHGDRRYCRLLRRYH